MSKTKKAVTNAKRERRVGTGQGIARPQQRPSGSRSWLWIVLGAVVLGAVAIGAAVYARGGGSSSSSGGDPAVVQARLATTKLDPLSEPTWPPNYDNLGPALAALNLPGQSDTVLHYHVHLSIFVNGKRVGVPAQIGLDQATQTYSPIHTHDETGVIHIEADDPSFRATLGQVFDVWGVQFSGDRLGGYAPVKMWVNGKPSAAGPSLVLQSHMQITIAAGTVPAGFKPQSSYKFPAGE